MMTIEWMKYPVSLSDEDEMTTISWSDGSRDVVPTDFGDGETIYELDEIMDEIFLVQMFNCSEGASGRFIDQFPALFRSNTGVLVLRVMSEESFMNAFVCKSKDASECLLSWMRGDPQKFITNSSHSLEGLFGGHVVNVRDVLAFIGCGLLDDFPPIVFDTSIDEGTRTPDLESLGLTPVELPWARSPRSGPDFSYPGCLFYRTTYESPQNVKTLDDPPHAISLSHSLDEGEWRRLVNECQKESFAEEIKYGDAVIQERFASVLKAAQELGSIWLERWRNLY